MPEMPMPTTYYTEPPLQPIAPLVRTHCRVCRQPLELVLTLGELALSDFPHSPYGRAHPPIPLDLCRCTRPECGLVQLGHTTPREWLYRQYWYRSGINETMVAELQDVVRSAIQRVDLQSHGPYRKPIVVDIGANDGTLLAQYPLFAETAKAIRVAYEPARNLYEHLRPHASVLNPTFFEVPGDSWPADAKAQIITAIAMFYDLDNPHAFVADLRKALAPEGVIVIQQAYLPAMLASVGLDNICHEHLEYYSLSSLIYLLAQHGLTVCDVELRAINGGSFRAYVQRQDTGGRPIDGRVEQLLATERELFLDPASVYRAFRHRVEDARGLLQATLEAYRASGRPVDLYGASTKANTLLQYCGIDWRVIRQAWERSPEKVGRYVGVSGIPIVDEAMGRADPPAALLLGIGAFRDAVLARESYYLTSGGRIIVPLPTVEIVQAQAPPSTGANNAH